MYDVIMILPEINPERCVYAHLASASCEACIDVCPTDAWAFEEDELTLDPERCVSCALCARVCPESALAFAVSIPLKQISEKTAGFVACKNTTLPTVPCRHAITLADIIHDYALGMRTLVVSDTECTDCSIYPGAWFETLVEQFNSMLRREHQPPLRLLTIEAGKWQKVYQTAPAFQGKRVGRRAFLTAALDPIKEEGEPHQSEQEKFLRQTLSSDTPIYPITPVINDQCDACTACFRACPHQVLLVVDHKELEIDPIACTGCRLCVDICDRDAIDLTYWQEAKALQYPLEQHKCTSCGVGFFTIGEQEETHCHICRKANHYKNLYQVM
jgi:ferredoxin